MQVSVNCWPIYMLITMQSPVDCTNIPSPPPPPPPPFLEYDPRFMKEISEVLQDVPGALCELLKMIQTIDVS